LVDWSAEELVISSSRDVSGLRYPLGSGIAGHVARTGDVVNVHDAYRDPRFSGGVDKCTGYRTKAILTVPVTGSKGQVMAVMQAVNKKSKGSFTEDDVLVLKGVAGQAALHLENVALFEKEQKQRKRLQVVGELARLLHAERKVDQVVKTIMGLTQSVVRADRCAVYVARANRFIQGGAPEAAGGERDLAYSACSHTAGFRLGPISQVADMVATSGVALRITDPAEAARYSLAWGSGDDQKEAADSAFRASSVLAVPVIDPQSRTMAVLEMQNSWDAAAVVEPSAPPANKEGVKTTAPPQVFSEHDEESLKTFASHCAIALANARNFEHLSTQTAHTEHLLQLASPLTASLDRDGCITMCTERFARLLPPGALSNKAHYSSWVLPDVHDRLAEDIAHVYSTGEGTAVVEYQLQMPFWNEEGQQGSEEMKTVNYKLRPIFSHRRRRVSFDENFAQASLNDTLVGVVLVIEVAEEFESVASKLKRSERKIFYLRQELDVSCTRAAPARCVWPTVARLLGRGGTNRTPHARVP
jgi:adenylate cyclase